MGSFCSLSFLKCMQGAGEEGKKTTHCFGFERRNHVGCVYNYIVSFASCVIAFDYIILRATLQPSSTTKKSYYSNSSVIHLLAAMSTATTATATSTAKKAKVSPFERKLTIQLGVCRRMAKEAGECA